MAELKISGARVRGGVWEGRLHGPAGAPKPKIEVIHAREALGDVSVEPEGEVDGLWLVRVPIPVALLSDGVQTFLIVAQGSGGMLARFCIVTGQPLEADLRAEIDLLRAELDLLKAVVRRLAAGRTD